MRTTVDLVARSVVGLVVFGLLLFLPAGTLAYWQAWVFLAAFSVATAGPTVYLIRRDPAALRRRMQAGKESRPAQRMLVPPLFLLCLAQLVFSVFDHRFGWSPLPAAVSLIGAVVVGSALLLTMAVVIQNSFAAGNVTVEEDQTVVSTGFYGVVRHPMYTFALLLLVAIPPALGSWWGIGFVVPMGAILVLRLLDEEKMLQQELDGYRDYMQQTRWRLVPYVW